MSACTACVVCHHDFEIRCVFLISFWRLFVEQVGSRRKLQVCQTCVVGLDGVVGDFLAKRVAADRFQLITVGIDICNAIQLERLLLIFIIEAAYFKRYSVQPIYGERIHLVQRD